jgi:DNA-binding transcriptional ArsR family regulator
MDMRMNSAPDNSTAPDDDSTRGESDQVFSSAAELFRLLSTPIRLKIISALCQTEKNVSQLLARSTPRSPT